MSTDPVVDRLLHSGEPSVRWKVRAHVLGDDPSSRPMRRLRDDIRRSPRVRRLLDGHAALRPATYAKWVGGHWVLAALAELGHPPGDESLVPLRDSVLRTWLAPRYLRDTDVVDGERLPSNAVGRLRGRSRRCGSQHGSALLSVVRLGLDDGDGARLAERLVHWQWPDGGWNCDNRPEAASSSLHETWLPVRALTAYADVSGDRPARAAADRAAEVLLAHRVVYRRSDPSRLVRPDWARLCYPPYWHYGLLAGLVALTEAGRIGDPRCSDALDLLEAARLQSDGSGGWPATATYQRNGTTGTGSRDHVRWGPTHRQRANEWVTADALRVLRAAGR